jgi:8-amino-7-oxononanoate synthase
VAAELNRAGFDVRAIRPPTVPDGSARLRLAVNSAIPDAEIARIIQVMAALQGVGAAA